MQARAEPRQPFTEPPTINFELSLAGSPSTDPPAGRAAATGLTGQVSPLSRQPRLQITQLRDFHLELTFQGSSADTPRRFRATSSAVIIE